VLRLHKALGTAVGQSVLDELEMSSTTVAVCSLLAAVRCELGLGEVGPIISVTLGPGVEVSVSKLTAPTGATATSGGHDGGAGLGVVILGTEELGLFAFGTVGALDQAVRLVTPHLAMLHSVEAGVVVVVHDDELPTDAKKRPNEADTNECEHCGRPIGASENLNMVIPTFRSAEVVGAGLEEQLAVAQGNGVQRRGRRSVRMTPPTVRMNQHGRAVSRTLDPHPKLTLKVVGGQSLAAPLVVHRQQRHCQGLCQFCDPLWSVILVGQIADVIDGCCRGA